MKRSTTTDFRRERPSPVMRPPTRRLGRLLSRQLVVYGALFAWIISMGGHLDVFQIIAYNRMIVDNYLSHDQASLTEAIKETFEAGASCPMCRAIDKARHETESPAKSSAPTTEKATAKAPVAECLASLSFSIQELTTPLLPFEPIPASHLRERPALPPPRSLV